MKLHYLRRLLKFSSSVVQQIIIRQCINTFQSVIYDFNCVKCCPQIVIDVVKRITELELHVLYTIQAIGILKPLQSQAKKYMSTIHTDLAHNRAVRSQKKIWNVILLTQYARPHHNAVSIYFVNQGNRSRGIACRQDTSYQEKQITDVCQIYGKILCVQEVVTHFIQ